MNQGTNRYLVAHDYDMGAFWWWVWAGSAAEIVEKCAEVEVVTDPDVLRRTEAWDLPVVYLGADDLGPLESFRAKRDAQCDQPGFGVLVGRGVVHVRYEDPDVEETFDGAYLLELGSDGRRLRQVVIESDGSVTAEGPDEWPFNPPFDLYDPKLAAMQIAGSEFEAALSNARTVNGAKA
ncbi:hypothetical protein [Catellatospora paridis]|uniref:hypothetical protein n=1 Tax=Catellatospora paridis TaxID=1617086 RepID=UPI0012D40957|nr:hypothetical protein [Catellatospora paridis]